MITNKRPARQAKLWPSAQRGDPRLRIVPSVVLNRLAIFAADSPLSLCLLCLHQNFISTSPTRPLFCLLSRAPARHVSIIALSLLRGQLPAASQLCAMATEHPQHGDDAEEAPIAHDPLPQSRPSSSERDTQRQTAQETDEQPFWWHEHY